MDLGVFQRHLENLRVVFLLHFILISWALVGYWSPTGYLFYNALFLLTLLWGLHNKESDEPILMALYINCLSILFDVPVILFFFPLIRFGSQILSVLSALLNLLLRFFTVVALSRLLESRSGTIPPFLSNILGGSEDRENRSYEDIDRATPHQSVPQTEVGVEPKVTCKSSSKTKQKASKAKSSPDQCHDKPKSQPCPDQCLDKTKDDTCAKRLNEKKPCKFCQVYRKSRIFIAAYLLYKT